jgi:hypothetical protein
VPIGKTCRDTDFGLWRNNTVSQQAPPIPLNVVEYLERMFPDKAPSLTDFEDAGVKAIFKAGAVHAVRHLRVQYEEQVKNFSVQRLKENY